MSLTKSQIGRYSRHLIMPEVGVQGQEKLANAKVLCIGAGGLGSPLALYLASAGIGTLGIVDDDVVDLSNLQRQILHAEDRIGELKVESAKKRLHELNSDITVNTYNLRLTSDNALDLFKNYDVIVDGTDNFATRYLVNDACVLLNKPNVYGSIFRFEGQATVFNHKGGPHYRDLYPEPPPPGMVPSCAEGGVLGILPGIIGVIQATETVKIILDVGETLSGRLMLYDSLKMTLGAGMPSGDAKITTTANNTVHNSSTVSGYTLFGVLGIEFSYFEILAGFRLNNIKYSEFDSMDGEYTAWGGQPMLGLGFSF